MTPCDEWTGACNERGYGRVLVDGRLEYTHRVAWREAHGPIPPGMKVLHTCDNPPCRNVDHLFLGTQADNLADMHAKGRHPGRKLTPADYTRLRSRRSEGTLLRDLAGEFGISISQVSKIARAA